MKFAIRDDDTSYFTKPEELEAAYDFVKEGCVSLSVVPFAVPVHKDCVFPYGENIEYGYYDIANNEVLIDYLKNQKGAGKFDFLLHGYSHEYKKIDGAWQSEMMWKSKEQLESELSEGKRHLEELLSCDISVLVAPNNHIDKKAISVCEKLGMNFSGIIGFNDRKFSFRYIINFIKRCSCRAFKKIQYPGVLNYGKHKELVAFTLDNFERLKYEYNECKKRNQPFVIYTHYWSINKSSENKKYLKQYTIM